MNGWRLNIEDEFIEESIEDVIEAYKKLRISVTGINFLYNGSQYSIFTTNGSFYFTSDNAFNAKRIEKIIEN